MRWLLAACLCGLVLTLGFPLAQADSQGANYVGAVGTTEWTGGSNAVGAGEVTCATGVNGLAGEGVAGNWNTFGFSVPTGARIDGIQVGIKASRTLAGGTTWTLSLRKSDASTDSAVRTADISNTDLCEATQEVATLGSGSDLWGTSWTAAELNDLGFTVRVIIPSGLLGVFLLNWVRVTVFYTPTVDLGEGWAMGEAQFLGATNSLPEVWTMAETQSEQAAKFVLESSTGADSATQHVLRSLPEAWTNLDGAEQLLLQQLGETFTIMDNAARDAVQALQESWVVSSALSRLVVIGEVVNRTVEGAMREAFRITDQTRSSLVEFLEEEFRSADAVIAGVRQGISEAVAVADQTLAGMIKGLRETFRWVEALAADVSGAEVLTSVASTLSFIGWLVGVAAGVLAIGLAARTLRRRQRR